MIHDVGHTAFPGLAVDTNNRLIGAPHVLRIDGQIGHLPGFLLSLAGEALADGVLVINCQGRVTLANRAADTMLDGTIAGKGIDDVCRLIETFEAQYRCICDLC